MLLNNVDLLTRWGNHVLLPFFNVIIRLGVNGTLRGFSFVGRGLLLLVIMRVICSCCVLLIILLCSLFGRLSWISYEVLNEFLMVRLSNLLLCRSFLCGAAVNWTTVRGFLRAHYDRRKRRINLLRIPLL